MGGVSLSRLLSVRAGAFFLAENRVRGRQQFRVIIVGQLAQESANAMERLAEEKLGGEAALPALLYPCFF
jgi:hypothetical protein